MTIKLFKREIAVAVKAYDKFIVCFDKTPEDFEASLNPLVAEAIRSVLINLPHNTKLRFSTGGCQTSWRVTKDISYKK